jgi:hypothetical protein
MWYRWKSLEEFNAWHEAAKSALGIPRPGKGLASGRERPTRQWTTIYTEPYVVSESDIRAVVEADALDVPGLGEPCDSPIIAAADEEPIADKSGEAWIMKAEVVERLRESESAK